jgi:hypothetical protein
MRASNSVLSSARSLLLRNCTCNLDAAAILQQSRGICGFVGASKEDGPSSTSATVLGTSVFRAAALSVPFSAARLLSTSSGVADSKLDLASKVLEQATVLTLVGNISAFLLCMSYCVISRWVGQRPAGVHLQSFL